MDAQPLFGQTGDGTTTYHSGNVPTYGGYSGYSNSTVNGTSYTPATYRMVGAVPVTRTIFERNLSITVQNREGANVIEGKVKSEGLSGI